MRDGATYGVGTVIVERFDAPPIVDRAAAERRMHVTTTPRPWSGAWSWIDDRKAHWRPRDYFPPTTAVRVSAGIYGAPPLGDGLYGQEDRSVGFTIGPSHVTIADDVTKQVSVYDDGKLVRTMPTSMGRGRHRNGGRQDDSLLDPVGRLHRDGQGKPPRDDGLVDLRVAGELRVGLPDQRAVRHAHQPDGIYLHEREATVWAQGNTNVSAGCLNLSAEDARWFYEFSQPGDVVEVRNTGGAPPLEQWQNGDWSVPWREWLEGSTLRG